MTETGAGQWGSSLAFASSLFGLDCEVSINIRILLWYLEKCNVLIISDIVSFILFKTL